jgi:hypothetical protein
LPDQAEEVVKAWSTDVQEAIEDSSQQRPRTLLVLLNPYGGSGRARGVWEREAFPLLAQAGARITGCLM